MHGKRVLVVDDDADQLETLQRGLVYLGHTCVPAATTAAALAQLALGKRIDLVLADLSAVAKPGKRVVEHVQALRPGLPILVVTGLVRLPEVIALGAQGIPSLCKPFSPDELGHAIDTALSSAATTNLKER